VCIQLFFFVLKKKTKRKVKKSVRIREEEAVCIMTMEAQSCWAGAARQQPSRIELVINDCLLTTGGRQRK
jgi:hypothetical protein